MKLKRKTRSLLSIIIALAMVMSLFTGLSFAAEGDGEGGGEGAGTSSASVVISITDGVRNNDNELSKVLILSEQKIPPAGNCRGIFYGRNPEGETVEIF